MDIGTHSARCAYADKTNGEAAPVIIPNRWGNTFTPLSAEENGENSIPDILCSLREDAEAFLGRFVSSCALTVPAFFSAPQLEVLKQSAKSAGLADIRTISKPAAAALTLGRAGRFMVLDCGAGTSAISIVEGGGVEWSVLEEAESANVGGNFDITLAEWMCERLQLGHIPEGDPRWGVLLREAEPLKIALSSDFACEWKPPSLNNREFPTINIEREELERMTRFSIKRLTNAARRLWDKYCPERLLLVGGASNTPLLRDMIEREITRPEDLNISAEGNAAAGAALYALAELGRQPGGPPAPSVGTQQARDFKIRLVRIEPSLKQAQKERLNFMVNELENLESDASSIEIFEGIVKGLEAEFLKKT